MPDNPFDEEAFGKMQACAGKEEMQTQNLFLYLSKILTLRQFCDFYGIVYNLQIGFGAFMNNDDNLKFGRVYNQTLNKFLTNKINFDVFKETVNSELYNLTQANNAEILIFIALSVLLGKDTGLIYNVLQQNVIAAQVESGEYYPF